MTPREIVSELRQAILEAAGPHMASAAKARALEEAADAIDADPYEDLDPFYAGWLRDRALRIWGASDPDEPLGEAANCSSVEGKSKPDGGARIMICKTCGAEVPFDETSEHTRTHK